MTYPAGVDLVTISDLLLLGPTPKGQVYLKLQPSVNVTLNSGATLIAGPIEQRSAGDGNVSLAVPATDSDNINPASGWHYIVTLKVDGVTIWNEKQLLLPKAAASVRLGELTPVADLDGTLVYSAAVAAVLAIDTTNFTELTADMLQALAEEIDSKLAAVTYDSDTDVSGKSWVIDEDDMSSDDATKVPTQQSVKAYAQAAADLEADTAALIGTGGALDTSLDARYGQVWEAGATYTQGQTVLAPSGVPVQAKANHTAGGTFDPADWWGQPEIIVGSYFGSWGAGDDTTAIANAIDAAVQQGGGTVVLPYINGYVPKASQIEMFRWVHLAGKSWHSFGLTGSVGRIEQLSGVNDDFVIFDDNGDVGSRPFLGPLGITDLVLKGAASATGGHGINTTTSDNRDALTQDFTTFQRLGLRGFYGSGFYSRGGSPIILTDIATLFNGGYGIELIDDGLASTDAIHHTVLTNISGDGNMGYLADEYGATVRISGKSDRYAVTMRGIKSEYRVRPADSGGDDVSMGNAHAIILDNCSGAIDITGVTHIATSGNPLLRKPKAPILINGAAVPDLRWDAVAVRGDLAAQTSGATPPIIDNQADATTSSDHSGELGPQYDARAAATKAYVDARGLSSPLVSGRYVTNAVQRATSGYGLTNETMFATPVTFDNSGTLDIIGARISTAGEAGSVVRLGIYEDDGTGYYPGALLLDAGTITGDSIGNKSISISQAVSAGTYWLVACAQSAPTTQPQVPCSLQGHPRILATGLSDIADGTMRSYAQTGVSGALPSTFSTTVTKGIRDPLVVVRAA